MVIHKIYEFQNWISEITGHMINSTQVSLIYFTHWAGSNDFIGLFLFKSLPQLPISANFEHGLLIIVTPSFGSNYCHFYLSTYSWIISKDLSYLLTIFMNFSLSSLRDHCIFFFFFVCFLLLDLVFVFLILIPTFAYSDHLIIYLQMNKILLYILWKYLIFRRP